jgi:hypothetical protein
MEQKYKELHDSIALSTRKVSEISARTVARTSWRQLGVERESFWKGKALPLMLPSASSWQTRSREWQPELEHLWRMLGCGIVNF